MNKLRPARYLLPRVLNSPCEIGWGAGGGVFVSASASATVCVFRLSVWEFLEN